MLLPVVIAGTSTGGLLAVALGLLRLDLDACEGIYRRLGRHVFNQSGTAAAPAEEAGWRDSLYRAYATGSANMRVAVYGAKHDAGAEARCQGGLTVPAVHMWVSAAPAVHMWVSAASVD